ncbi:MAG TPA: glycosyltransferase family 2 protein [Acidimicrobiia bacterium]|nr:glycosyltransferase family 2 protein [Acidimicrobiia bacterium]
MPGNRSVGHLVKQEDSTRQNLPSSRDSDRAYPSVSVSIVNHSSRDLLRACLESLRHYPYTFGEMEVVVLDNASTDGSVEMLENDFADVVVLAERERRGFGANQNRAVRTCRGDLVFIFNPDAVVHEHTIDRLVSALAWDERVAVAGGPIVNADHTFRQDRPHPFPTPFSPLAKAFGLQRLWARRRIGQAVIDDGWPSGGACLIERRAFVEVGGFDEDFFMYSEDVDLFARLVAQGRLVAWVDDAIVTHPYRDEPAPLAARREAEIVHAELQYMRKHFGRVWVYRIGVIIDAALRLATLSTPWTSRFVNQHGKSVSYNLQAQRARLAAAISRQQRPGLRDLAREWNNHRPPGH